MIEVYSFLAVFLVQILVMSVLYPLRLSRLVQTNLKSSSAERLAEFYPGVDVGRAHERFITRYRTANAVVAVLGLLLLGGFFSYTKRPDWDEGRLGVVLTAYCFLQYVPIILFGWFTTRFNKVHRRSSPESKRKAILQRRGLFDFISPLTVVLAILSYSSFVAFMFYVARHPFPGFAGPLPNIGILTLGYMLLGSMVYWQIYGRKTDPLQTHANRLHTIRVTVNNIAWMFILAPIVLSLTSARRLLDLDSWSPFLGSLVFLTIGLVSFRALSAPPRQPEMEGLGSSTVR
ncbi:MAG: hypothetical protein ABIQ86_03725 [Steroidobacteraceae bacterium]